MSQANNDLYRKMLEVHNQKGGGVEAQNTYQMLMGDLANQEKRERKKKSRK